MERCYDDGFSGFTRRTPEATNRLGSFMSDSHAEAWFPRPQPRELQFSEEQPQNPIVRRVGSKHPRSPPKEREDSRPKERNEVNNLLDTLPKHSRIKSILKGPFNGAPPNDDSDESNDDERSVASSFRHVVKKESRRKRSESLAALREHSAKVVKLITNVTNVVKGSRGGFLKVCYGRANCALEPATSPPAAHSSIAASRTCARGSAQPASPKCRAAERKNARAPRPPRRARAAGD
jgi:hypothetical protein